MPDQTYQIKRLAEFILTYSLELKKSDFVLIEGIDVSPNTLSLFKSAAEKLNLKPIILYKSIDIIISNNNLENKELLQVQAKYELGLMKLAKAFIGLRKPVNPFALNQLTETARENVIKYFVNPVHFKYRNNNMQWVYFRFPTTSMIDLLKKATECRADYFDSVFISYQAFKDEMEPLIQRLSGTTTINIVSEKTDLEFTLAGQEIYKSVGKHNLPDGEVFTSPKRDSIDGKVYFNIPSTYMGSYFEEVELTFKEGRVVDARSKNNTLELINILDIDEGAKYCGEFAFGLNPFIRNPINDILYDEKMTGSFHLALGNAYPDSDNGNRSGIHWDLIQDMYKTNAKIFFDGELVMQDGRFITSDLARLNPEKLKSTL